VLLRDRVRAADAIWSAPIVDGLLLGQALERVARQHERPTVAIAEVRRFVPALATVPVHFETPEGKRHLRGEQPTRAPASLGSSFSTTPHTISKLTPKYS